MEERRIGIRGVAINIPQMIARKDDVVASNGVEHLFRKNKVEWVKGSGSKRPIACV